MIYSTVNDSCMHTLDWDQRRDRMSDLYIGVQIDFQIVFESFSNIVLGDLEYMPRSEISDFTFI